MTRRPTPSWPRIVLPMAVLVAAGHMAKALEKLATWAGYLPGALREPLAEKAVLDYAGGVTPMPGALLPMAVVSAVGLGLIGAALFYALRESRLSDPTGHGRRRLPLVVTAVCVGALVAGWVL